MNKNFIIIILLLIIVVLGGYLGFVLFRKEKTEEPKELITVKVFFGNSKLNPGVEDCRLVYPVERKIPKTQAVAIAALEELLKGPTEAEKQEGYFTSINSGVKIQDLNIEDSVAKVDFDEQLEFQVGGSCKVAAIRYQIYQTLEQFPTVKSVIISINGRTEDILQP
jgi:spore germination protein GerM